jgi:hypothetical protein
MMMIRSHLVNVSAGAPHGEEPPSDQCESDEDEAQGEGRRTGLRELTGHDRGRTARTTLRPDRRARCIGCRDRAGAVGGNGDDDDQLLHHSARWRGRMVGIHGGRGGIGAGHALRPGARRLARATAGGGRRTHVDREARACRRPHRVRRGLERTHPEERTEAEDAGREPGRNARAWRWSASPLSLHGRSVGATGRSPEPLCATVSAGERRRRRAFTVASPGVHPDPRSCVSWDPSSTCIPGRGSSRCESASTDQLRLARAGA